MMFVRWVHRAVSGYEGNWECEQSVTGLESHSAILLRSYREGGKPRQERIASLGTYHTRHGRVSSDFGVEHDKYAAAFWGRARRILDNLNLTDSDMRKAIASLAKELPEPRQATTTEDDGK